VAAESTVESRVAENPTLEEIGIDEKLAHEGRKLGAR
jgi:hypothetical protein